MAIKIQIANGFYKSKSLPISNQECVNLYPNIPKTSGALSDDNLFQTPGISELASSTVDRESNRGAITMAGIPYFVNKSTMYSLGSDFRKTSLGSISGLGRVSMATNGTQVMILVPGGDGYIYSVAGGLVTITDSDFTALNAQIVVFIDSYFAVTSDAKVWAVSANNDGTSWYALDIGSAETDPDFVVAPVVVNNQIMITGTITTEAFQNVGSTVVQSFPFQRSGLFLDKGCAAPFSLVNASGSFFMIGKGENETPAIYQYANNNFQKISDPAIDAYINSLSQDEVYEAFALSYAIDGAHFVSFSFKLTTFVYNLVTGRWHEQKSMIDEVLQRWRVNSIVTAYGVTIVADSYDGRIGKLDADTYGEYGNDIIKTVSGQVLESGGDSFSLQKVELTIESGVGNTVYGFGNDILRTWEIVSGAPDISGDEITFVTDIGPRTWTIQQGSPVINGDSISFINETAFVQMLNYWKVGTEYRINCTVSNFVGNGGIFLPYDGTEHHSFPGYATANGTYEYLYTPDTGTGIVQVKIASGVGHTADVTVNWIREEAASVVEVPTYWEIGKTYRVNCLVVGHSGDGDIYLPFDGYGDDIPRTFIIAQGSPTINGDTISFINEIAAVQVLNYWTEGTSYRVNCTVSNYSGSGNIWLPYDGDMTYGPVVSANGTYEYTYTPVDGYPLASMVVDQLAGHTADVTVNWIKEVSYGDIASTSGTYEYFYTPSNGTEITDMMMVSDKGNAGVVTVNAIQSDYDLLSGVEDPSCEMTVSRDGKTFERNPRKRKMGKIGEFNKRLIWRGISLFKRFGHLKWRFSDQVKTVVIKAEVE